MQATKDEESRAAELKRLREELLRRIVRNEARRNAARSAGAK